jgi:hypothetical protein
MIYTELYDYLKTAFPKLKASQNYNSNPQSFPYMYFFQIDGTTAISTLSDTEDGVSLAFQIEFYTNTSMNDARKIANDARNWMIENSFRCAYFNPVPNVTNSKVNRFVTRFSRLDV